MRLLIVLAVAAIQAAAQQCPQVPLVFINGTCQPTGVIQDAIANAANGDLIEVLATPGAYVENIDFLGKAITLRSINGRATIQGSSNPALPVRPVVSFVSGEGPGSRLEGFAITGGTTSGIRCASSSPTIVDCRIETNSGLHGGGLDLLDSDPSFDRCTIDDNVAVTTNGFGGGLKARGTSQPRFTGCTFSDNRAHSGGGIYLADFADAVFTSCIVRTNTASGNGSKGGGVAVVGSARARFVGGHIERNRVTTQLNTLILGGGVFGDDTSSLALERCHIVGNVMESGTTAVGAGVACDDSCQLEMTSSLVAGNTSRRPDLSVPAGSSSGVHLRGSGVWGRLLNCTVADCTSGSSSGALVVETNGGRLQADNCIVWGVTPVAIRRNAPATMVFVNSSDIQGGWTGSGNIDADPLFTNSAAGDHRLTTPSPCVDSGNPAPFPGPSLDLDGLPRIVGVFPDMGAFELHPALPALRGTGEDFVLLTTVNAVGSPVAVRKTARVSDQLSVTVLSPYGTFDGIGIPIVGAQAYATAGPAPCSPCALPGIHVDHNQPIHVLFDARSAGPLGPIYLGPGGLSWLFFVPSGLGGTTLRLQAVAITPLAANGIFAASDAHDVTLL